MLNKKEETIIDVLKKEFLKRNNPKDLKAAIIGKIVELSPLTLQIADGNILLTEGVELEISQWVRFRCNIDSTGVLSLGVLDDTNNAKSIQETHSYTNSACQMPSAISSLASAILGLRDELLKLKCVW